MHGYNQGSCLIRDVICSRAPDVIMLQEHWLTPHNMSRCDKDFPDYHLFDSSAMELSVEEGPLIGRPFRGTAMLVKNELLSVSECVLMCLNGFLLLKLVILFALIFIYLVAVYLIGICCVKGY